MANDNELNDNHGLMPLSEGLDNGIMLTPSIEIRWNKSRTELSINHKPSRTCIMDFEVHDGKLESVYYDSDPSFWQQ
jgi:hypothetical protein